MKPKVRFELDKAVLVTEKVPANMRRVLSSSLSDLNHVIRDIEREYKFDKDTDD